MFRTSNTHLYIATLMILIFWKVRLILALFTLVVIIAYYMGGEDDTETVDIKQTQETRGFMDFDDWLSDHGHLNEADLRKQILKDGGNEDDVQELITLRMNEFVQWCNINGFKPLF